MRAAAEYQEQDWQVVQDSSDESQPEPEAGEAFECVACNKTFQSEASWNNHERSKKHKQAVYRYVLYETGIDRTDYAGRWSSTTSP